MNLQDAIAKLAAHATERNFRPWNIDAYGNAHQTGTKKGEKIYRLIWEHDPEVHHTVTGSELNTIGRFV